MQRTLGCHREGFQQSDWWTLVLDGRRSMYTLLQFNKQRHLCRTSPTRTGTSLVYKEQLVKDSDYKSLPLRAGVLPPTGIFFSLLLLFIFFYFCFWLLQQQQWLVCSCFCDTRNEASARGRRESSSALLLASWPMCVCVYIFACEKTHSVSVWFTQLPGWSSSSIYTRRFSSAAVTELGYCLINLHGATNLHRGCCIPLDWWATVFAPTEQRERRNALLNCQLKGFLGFLFIFFLYLYFLVLHALKPLADLGWIGDAIDRFSD